MSQSTRSRSVSKRDSGFPLWVHSGTGLWAKKIRQRTHYFGPVKGDENGQKALAKWLEQKDDLLAGRRFTPKSDGLTLAKLCNAFLASKDLRLQSGELAARTFQDYRDVCKRLLEHFGRDVLVTDLRPTDFDALRGKWSKAWGPQTVSNLIGRARAIFRFTEEMDDAPVVRLGKSFSKPSAKTMRVHRAAKVQEHGHRMFSADELRSAIEAAPPVLKAMLLLAANCAFGQSDCSSLPQSAIKGEWIEFARAKTGIGRRCLLWGETIRAVEAAIAIRPDAKDPADDGLVFLTRTGVRWVKLIPSKKKPGEFTPDDAIAKEFRKLLKKLGINRRGLNFYGIRHGFQTVAEETKDFSAVSALMGHADSSMAGAYRERIDDSRLRAVVDHIHHWLFPVEEKAVGNG